MTVKLKHLLYYNVICVSENTGDICAVYMDLDILRNWNIGVVIQRVCRFLDLYIEYSQYCVVTTDHTGCPKEPIGQVHVEKGQKLK